MARTRKLRFVGTLTMGDFMCASTSKSINRAHAPSCGQSLNCGVPFLRNLRSGGIPETAHESQRLRDLRFL